MASWRPRGRGAFCNISSCYFEDASIVRVGEQWPLFEEYLAIEGAVGSWNRGMGFQKEGKSTHQLHGPLK